MSSKTSLVAMTESGLATILGAGKIRWTPIAGGATTESADANNTILSSGSNTSVSHMAVSKDSEWLVASRYIVPTGGNSGVTTVSLMKLKGGDGTEITLNTKEAGVSLSGVNALYIDSAKKVGAKTVYIGDKNGTLLSCQITSSGLGSGQNASAQLVAKNLGSISAISAHDGAVYAAVNDGVNIVKLDPTSGVQQDQWPMTAYPPIRRLAVLPTLNAIVVGARHRHINVHSLDHSFDAQTLACDDKPTQVDANTYRQNNVHHFLALSESGKVNIFRYNKPSKTPLQPSGTISLDPNSTKGHSILAARFCSPNQIIVAYGTYVKPAFKKITYVNAKNDEILKDNVILSDETGVLLGNTKESDKMDVDAEPKQKAAKVRTVHAGEAHISSMKSDLNTKEELTFAERLGKPDQAAKSAASQKAAAASGAAPRVASNVAVLTSALSSHDKQQLATVLAQQDPRVIAPTIRGLPLSSVMPLLLELMTRFAHKPSASLAAWLRYLLIVHQSYLTSLPELIGKLGGLYNSLDERLKSMPDLLRLNGRFELLLNHMDLNPHEAEDSTAFHTYVEGPDDEDFDEDSEESDEDDEFDEEDEEEEEANFGKKRKGSKRGEESEEDEMDQDASENEGSDVDADAASGSADGDGESDSE